MEEYKRIVEINGVKIEVDLRTAKRVDNFKVGDHVKVLIKEYSSYKSNLGVIIGFDEFKNLPSIVVAYLNISYSCVEIKFLTINSETKDVEIAPCQDQDLVFEKADILGNFDREIEKKREEIRDIERKKNYFLHHYSKYFDSINNGAK
jgi:hypothetical protein